MSESESSRFSNGTVNINSIINTLGKLSILIGVILFLRIIFEYFSEELLFVLDTVLWICTYGYVGPAFSFILIGVILVSIGSSVDGEHKEE